MSKKGFTLIEMLVVIAIIGILAGLLSGPLMRAKTNADVTKCLNNAKQLGGAMFQYQNDKSFVPKIETVDDADLADADEMAQSLGLLVVTGYADDPALFQCPLAGGLTETFQFERADLNADETNTEFAARVYNENMTAYLITPNLSMRSKSNMPILADRAWEGGTLGDGGGYTTAHGDTEETAGDMGGSVLMKDNSVKSVRDAEGKVENSADNKTAATALWLDAIPDPLGTNQAVIIQ